MDNLSPSAKGVQLSLIAPVYNEEESIPIFVDRALAVLDKIGLQFEIIIVNDGSTDASSTKLASLHTGRGNCFMHCTPSEYFRSIRLRAYPGSFALFWSRTGFLSEFR